jgi:hydrogenase expression/formation protein HypC
LKVEGWNEDFGGNMCLGVPGKIVEVYEANGLIMGKIDFGGVTREACLAYVPEATVGDYTIIHVGFALHLISEAEAQETLKLLRQISDVETGLNSDEVR